MPVELGSKPAPSFRQPLELMSDCHKRILHFLDIMKTVSRDAGGGLLSPQQQTAFRAALEYFRDSAPWHCQDEEDSLFPRLRAHDRGRQALNRIETLEADHALANSAEKHLQLLGWRWVQTGQLSHDEARRFDTQLAILVETYPGHIKVEDEELFPLAAQTLSPEDLRAMGREMAKRRGINPDDPRFGLVEA